MLVAVCVAAEASQPEVPQPSGHPLRQLKADAPAQTDQAAHAFYAGIPDSDKLPATQCTKNADATTCPKGQAPGCCLGAQCIFSKEKDAQASPATNKKECEEFTNAFYACCKAPKNGQSMVGLSFLSFIATGVTMYVCL